ncbi:hypothetical protein ABIA39_003279 [Nocardia sp. GAS34]|uniref:hypothetical protein n=1 Tax=unclassified Nocardia TaxID=2637762 RepID=UPI003D1C41FD
MFDPADTMLDVLPEAAQPVLAHASRLTGALRHRDVEYQAELGWWTGDPVRMRGSPARHW